MSDDLVKVRVRLELPRDVFDHLEHRRKQTMRSINVIIGQELEAFFRERRRKGEL